jgi:hypothetical protein
MTRMAEVIEQGNFGVVMTEDINTHGYYLVHWASADEWAIGELTSIP